MAKRKSDLHERVRLRAAECCEYCQLPQQYDPLPFHVEHIISKKHRGRSTTGNLALSCGSCNLHKSSNIAGLDAATGKLTRLFNPRRDVWHEHFTWEGPALVGITSVGRTTVEAGCVPTPDGQNERGFHMSGRVAAALLLRRCSCRTSATKSSPTPAGVARWRRQP